MQDKKNDGLLLFIYDIGEMFFFIMCALLLIMVFFFRQVTVDGHSMENTLQDKDRLIVWSCNYAPKQGDIITISHGAFLDEQLIKRIIATEGQRIKIDYDKNEVSVDGKILEEDYIKGRTIKARDYPINESDIVVPEGYVFVMGDNREHSTDSRSMLVDMIPVNNIMGKAFFRISPLNSFGNI